MVKNTNKTLNKHIEGTNHANTNTSTNTYTSLKLILILIPI